MKKNYNFTLLWVCLLLVSFTVPGFSQVLRGRVTDAQTGEGLPGVSVAVAASGQGTGTDNSGNYSLRLSPGSYRIQYSFIGYTTLTRDVTIGSSDVTLNIPLSPSVQSLTDVVVVGSRSTQVRSSVETVAPVDIISSRELQATGQIEPTQMINLVAPSFNSSRQTIADGTDHIDPATLRGLGPDQVLVLLNGKRRHNQALINVNGTIGRGSVGTDLNTIPTAAIERIEVLREGAASQYGSDAIAGVINVVLRKDTGTAATLHLGRFYEGDGATAQLGLYHGMKLGSRGVISAAADIRFREATNRAGDYTGPVYVNWNASRGTNESEADWLARRQNLFNQDRALIAERGFDLSDNMQIGQSQVANLGLMLNGNYRISPRTELYFSGIGNYRRGQAAGFYRYPSQATQNIPEIYPNGFLPQIHSTILDRSVTVGIGGDLGDGWRWDLSNVYGGNAFRFDVKNSLNASQFALGKNAPTEFYSGTIRFNQNTSDFGISKDFGSAMGLKSFNVASGLSYRLDNYQIEPGEEASYRNFDLTATPLRAGGAQVFPGFQPDNQVNTNRTVMAGYVDIETDITERLLLNTAGRYEYYSDFGGNLAGKLSGRYKFADFFSLRGTVANGFRAPSIHQRFFSAISTVFVTVPGQGLQPRQQGTFPNGSAVAQAFGIPSLEAERSLSYSLGITSQPLSNLSVTVDAYQIDINDRIILTSAFQRGTSGIGPRVGQLLDAAGQTEVESATFFTNAVSTRTRGIDIVLASDYQVGSGTLTLTLAGNINRTDVKGAPKVSETLPSDVFGNALFNRLEESRLERAQPRNKFTLSGNYQIGKWRAYVRTTRYGEVAVLDISNRVLDETFSPKMVTDLSVSYQLLRYLQITAGANNLFDVYPDPLRQNRYPTPGDPTNLDNTSFGRFVYSRGATQFGFNGGYYFLNLAARF